MDRTLILLLLPFVLGIAKRSADIFRAVGRQLTVLVIATVCNAVLSAFILLWLLLGG